MLKRFEKYLYCYHENASHSKQLLFFKTVVNSSISKKVMDFVHLLSELKQLGIM